MAMMTDVRLLQIIPAGGWKAVYFDGNGEPYARDLVCFALVEKPETKDREVIGLEAGIAYVFPTKGGTDPLGIDVEINEGGPSLPWFLGYCGPSQNLSEFEENARKGAERWSATLARWDAEHKAKAEAEAQQVEGFARTRRELMRLWTRDIYKKKSTPEGS